MIPRPKPVTSYSGDTKKMLDNMMNASGIPQAEQRRLRAAVNAGPSAQLEARRRPLPVGRVAKYSDPLRGVAINPALAMRMGGATRRSQADIVAANGGSLERPQFRGGPPVGDREASKEALQSFMQFGGRPPAARSSAAAAPAPPAAPPPRLSEEAKLRNAIVTEIEERQSFLESMRAMGRAAEHEQTIANQIAERMQELTTLDKLEAK